MHCATDYRDESAHFYIAGNISERRLNERGFRSSRRKIFKVRVHVFIAMILGPHQTGARKAVSYHPVVLTCFPQGGIVYVCLMEEVPLLHR